MTKDISCRQNSERIGTFSLPVCQVIELLLALVPDTDPGVAAMDKNLKMIDKTTVWAVQTKICFYFIRLIIMRAQPNYLHDLSKLQCNNRLLLLLYGCHQTLGAQSVFPYDIQILNLPRYKIFMPMQYLSMTIETN